MIGLKGGTKMTTEDLYETYVNPTGLVGVAREPIVEIELIMKDSFGDIKAKGIYYSIEGLEEDLYKFEQIEESEAEKHKDFGQDNL